MSVQTPARPEGLNQVLERNIEALLARRARETRSRGLQERLADAITRFSGSMAFVYLHVLLFGTWLVWNSGLLNVPRFDPSYVILAMFASVEALFLSTFVLISQNRMSAQDERRAELHLQISLLAEHEVTRLITLVNALTERAGVDPKVNRAELEELRRDVAPEQVLEKIEEERDRRLS